MAPTFVPLFQHHREMEVSLQTLINNERAGIGANVEGLLRQFLKMNGNHYNQDITWGASVPAEIRIQMEALGFSPDSENEIVEFLNQNGINARFPFILPEDEEIKKRKPGI